ncbi:MAG: hypothetical protein O3A63_06515 [Proteobacteria bacterium]|nr:hypothetical protein [Pseudomonadota bacterium]
MRILLYSDLDTDSIPGFAKVRQALEAGNFTQADVRKIGENLYRARLNKRDRLLFRLHKYQGEQCVLLLEHIVNHAYDRSRFLTGGAMVDEAKIPAVEQPEADEGDELVYLHPERERFHLLDKILSFDDDQQAILELPPPLVIVGSAGSGKTALTMEKMKRAAGDVLYVSLSPYLVQNARNLYFAHGYDNDQQLVDFLSFHEVLESIHVPPGRELSLRDFQRFFERHRRGMGPNDAHKLFEEFRGVITGPLTEQGYRTREEYLELGVKQSIFLADERPRVYDLFKKYLAYLDSEGLFDANLVAHSHLARATSCYDFIVVDEVQDVTTVQLYLLLKLARRPGAFLLSGDSNQIVHPNFFSWAGVKSLFFREQDLTGDGEVIRVLHANYRNAPVVTTLANRILKLKHARFGSVDRESNYLVQSVGAERGRLRLLGDDERVKRELDARTASSTRYAVIVMHPEQKAEAKRYFSTPLVFSIQEAKGLEYENVILYNFVTGEARAFHEIAGGVDPAALEADTLSYARGRDKTDKSLEIFKFFINALYVAVTRAVRNLYVIEGDHGHPALALLQLDRFAGELDMDKEASSVEEWQREARKLELQGKAEQAEDIRERVLKQREVPWERLDREAFAALRERALTGGGKKAQLAAFEYAVIHHHRPTLNALGEAGFKPARRDEAQAERQLVRNHFMIYDLANPGAVLADVQRYGVDHRTRFNLTPLMIAARLGNAPLVEALCGRGADLELRANNGFTALHFALERAVLDPAYARQRLPRIYPLLEPDSVSVQVEGRLVKLDKRLMETFLLNFLTALYYRQLGPTLARSSRGYSAKMLEEALECLPNSVVPERRKRRPYISSILSKNEIHRDNPYNRRLFLRIQHGNYILNPGMKLRRGEDWRPLYEVLPTEDLGMEPLLARYRDTASADQRHYLLRVDDDQKKRLEEFHAFTAGWEVP